MERLQDVKNFFKLKKNGTVNYTYQCTLCIVAVIDCTHVHNVVHYTHAMSCAIVNYDHVE